MIMTAVPASAFHGSPYVLDGTASLPGLPLGIWDAHLEWGGAFGLGGGSFRLLIKDPDSGQTLVSTTIIGRESLPTTFFAAPTCSGVERVTPYVGMDSQTNGVVFKVTGNQDNCLGGPRSGQRYMSVEGNYQVIWALKLSTGIPF
jgi:hypothetical protein